MKRAAVLCASGIGDGLLMMIAAHHLKKKGYVVTIFHEATTTLSPLFEHAHFSPYPPLRHLTATLKPFDRILVQNDHSERSWHLFKERKVLPQLSFFFPIPSSQIQANDYLFHPYVPVATNLAKGCETLLGTSPSKDNALPIPQGKIHRKHPKRIVMHPTSNDLKRNWSPRQFVKLSQELERLGYTLSFCVAPYERKNWEHLQNVPTFHNLQEVAGYIYESGYLIGNDSGLGHLASNLKIPTLTISGNLKRVRLWRPDWCVGEIVTPILPLPNFKGIHLKIRDNFWQHFIPVRRTLKAFHHLVKKYETTSQSSSHLF